MVSKLTPRRKGYKAVQEKAVKDSPSSSPSHSQSQQYQRLIDRELKINFGNGCM